MTTAQQLPTAWNKAQKVSIIERRDKAELIGKPFLITAVELNVKDNDSGVYETVRVMAEDVNGVVFEFTDASTGVKVQLIEHLEALGYADKLQLAGEEFTVKGGLVIDGGLRVSNYKNANGSPARTFYLVSSGK